MTEPPPRVLLGPFVYTVTLCPLADDSAGDADGRNLAIRLDTRHAPGAQRETLLHELLHACHQAAGLPDEFKRMPIEELVTRVAPFLLDALRRSPGLVDYLLGDDDR